MLDENGYPDEISLKEIREWDIIKKGVQGLLDLIEENTWMPDWAISISGKKVLRFQYHTAGWFGNEDIMSALEDNPLFFPMYWDKSSRGGHYNFKIKLIKEGDK